MVEDIASAWVEDGGGVIKARIRAIHAPSVLAEMGQVDVG